MATDDGSRTNAFWKKVEGCSHANFHEDYSVSVGCAHTHLGCSGGHESHCKDCGVYITDDPCGESAGMSGWSHRRWKKKDNRHWSGKVRWGLTAL